MATCAKAVANSAPRCQGAAFEALEVGLSVIPVGRDKRPLVRWQAFQQRRATEEEAEEWFARWPDAQIGLVTGGLSGVDVVDFDTRDAPWPPRGRELPTDVVVATGGGGLHYYVRHTAGVRNSAGRLADGVDVLVGGISAAAWATMLSPLRAIIAAAHPAVEGTTVSEVLANEVNWFIAIAVAGAALTLAAPGGAQVATSRPTKEPGRVSWEQRESPPCGVTGRA